MKGENKTLLQLMDGSDNRFIIPVYQRNYDWEHAQCLQLYDDLVDLVHNHRKSHFFGCMVRCALKGSGPADFLIIDGQQRITTICLLFLAIYWNIHNGSIVSEDERLAEKIYKKFLVDEFNTQETKIRLKLNKDDSNAFNSLIENGDNTLYPHSKITKNYTFFCEQVKALSFKVDELYKAIQKLTVIDIFLHDEDDPQLIFESLNSTGLALSESDKIRNFILMGIKEEEQENLYFGYWNTIEKNCSGRDGLDKFIRNYLIAKSPSGEIPSLKKIYPFFKVFAHNKDRVELLSDLKQFSTYYYKITNSDIASPKANEIMYRINYLDMTVTYSFLMNFLHYAHETQLPDTDIIKVLSCLESFIFRRLICGFPTNALIKIFAALHQQIIKNQGDSDYYSVMVYFLLNRKKMEQTFPNDEEFLENFQRKSIYQMNSKNRVYILDRLENGNSKEKNNIIDNVLNGVLSVEHIMPQTLSESWKRELGPDYDKIHEKWLHTIANLTLTGYNSEYSNRSFVAKKEDKNGFKNSALRLNHYISQFDKWTKDELKTRSKYLAEEALKLWFKPQTDFIPEKQQYDTVSIGDKDFKFSGQAVTGFRFMGKTHEVNGWAEVTQKVFKELYALDPTILKNSINAPNTSFAKSKEESGFRKIVDDLWVDVHSNTNKKIRLIRKYLKLYNIEFDDLVFFLKSNPQLFGRHRILTHDKLKNLNKIGIHKNSFLLFIPTQELVKVVGDSEIEYNNESYNLTEFVWKYLNDLMDKNEPLPSISDYGFVKSGSIFGWMAPNFFSYNGKILTEYLKQKVVGYKEEITQ